LRIPLLCFRTTREWNDACSRLCAAASPVASGPGAAAVGLRGGVALGRAGAWAVPSAWFDPAAQPGVQCAPGTAVLAVFPLRRARQRAGLVAGGDEAAGVRRGPGPVPAPGLGGALVGPRARPAPPAAAAQPATWLSQPRPVRPSRRPN